MYKLIIADDELKIRTLLSEIVDWNGLGFEITGLFSDGKEVIDYIKNNPVDCILCDIRMTNVTGIDIAKYVYNHMPQIKVMLISGYQEFSYATAAITYGVENYFLKPVNIKEIKSAFEILRNKLDQKKSNSEIIACYKRDILKNLVSGIYKDYNDISNAFQKTHLEVSPHDACAVFKTVFDSELDLSEDALINMFQNVSMFNNSSVNTFYICNDNTSVKYILFSSNKNKTQFENTSSRICRNISEISGIPTKIVSFEYFDSVISLCESFNNKTENSIKIQEEMLISAINSCNIEDVNEIFSAIFNNVNTMSHEDIQNYLYKLIEKTCSELNKIINNLHDKIMPEKYLVQLNSTKTIDDLENITKSCLTDLTSVINEMGPQKQNILRIRNYIAAHCTDDDLSLERVASMAYMSPTYFSMIFKNIVGQTYIDFVIFCKMNKAKDLLINSQLKIYEISTTLGYANSQSFSKLFKSFCGITPSEYRIKFAKDV